MVQLGRHRRPALRNAGALPGTLNRKAVAIGVDRDAAGIKPRRCHGETVALLHPQLADPQHPGGALGAGGRHGEHRVFIDHAGRACGRHVDAAQLAAPDAEIGDRLAALFTAVQQIDAAAHLDQRIQQPGAPRVDPDSGQGDVGLRSNQRRHDREGGRADIARHDDLPAQQLGLAGDRDRLSAALCVVHGDRNPEMPQHVFGMVAGRMRLDHGGDPGRIQPGQQDRRLHLRGGDRQSVGDRNRRPCTDHGHRQPCSVPGHELRAHPDQRHGHPRHRSFHQRGVAGHEGSQAMGGQHARQQPRGGAAVAHVQDFRRLGQAADPDAMDQPRAVLAPSGLGPEGAHCRHRPQHVLALQQSFDLSRSDRLRTQHQRTVRNRLIARHADRARQFAGGVRRQGLHRSISVSFRGLRYGRRGP